MNDKMRPLQPIKIERVSTWNTLPLSLSRDSYVLSLTLVVCGSPDRWRFTRTRSRKRIEQKGMVCRLRGRPPCRISSITICSNVALCNPGKVPSMRVFLVFSTEIDSAADKRAASHGALHPSTRLTGRGCTE